MHKMADVEWLLGTHFSIDEQLQAESQLKETSSKMFQSNLHGIIILFKRHNADC